MPAWWWATGARWTGMTRRSFSIAYKHIHTSTTTCLHHVYHSLFMWLLTQLRWRRPRHAAPRRAVLPVAVAVGLLLVQLQKVESYILLLCQALLMCFGSSFLIECHHPTTAGSMCRYVTGLSEPGVPRYPPYFGRSVNPISTGATDYAEHIATGPLGLSDLPTALMYVV